MPSRLEVVQWPAVAQLDSGVLECYSGKETEKFAQCVKALHGNIMEAYLDWCEHVRLPARVPGVQYNSLTSNTRAPVGHARSGGQVNQAHMLDLDTCSCQGLLRHGCRR